MDLESEKSAEDWGKDDPDLDEAESRRGLEGFLIGLLIDILIKLSLCVNCGWILLDFFVWDLMVWLKTRLWVLIGLWEV